MTILSFTPMHHPMNMVGSVVLPAVGQGDA
jgi:hypothetical protein